MFVVDQQTGDICHQFALLKTYIKQLPSTARKSNLHSLHGENMYVLHLVDGRFKLGDYIFYFK